VPSRAGGRNWSNNHGRDRKKRTNGHSELNCKERKLKEFKLGKGLPEHQKEGTRAIRGYRLVFTGRHQEVDRKKRNERTQKRAERWSVNKGARWID